MERRDFIQLGLVGMGAGIAAPVASMAGTAPFPANADLVYSQKSQGRWAGKAATHIPNIAIDKADGNIKVQVVTGHEMKAYEHYIVKHVLLDKDFRFIDEHFFNPMEEKVARSVFSLANYQGTLYALSYCNKHDLWINSIEI